MEFRVVEHLYRWSNWNITAKSDDFTRKIADHRVPHPGQARRGTHRDLHRALFVVNRERRLPSGGVFDRNTKSFRTVGFWAGTEFFVAQICNLPYRHECPVVVKVESIFIQCLYG